MKGSHWSGVPCSQHAWEEVTNFCLHFQCMKPLCPECVSVHTKIHALNDIESWNNCFMRATTQLRRTLEELRIILNANTLNTSFKSLQIVQGQNLQQLRQLKERTHKMIDEIFARHEQTLIITLRNQYKIEYPDGTKLKTAIEQIENILLKMNSPVTAVVALTRAIKLEHTSLLKYFQQMKIPSNKVINQNFFSINTNSLNAFKESLAQLLIFSTQEQQQNQRQKPNTHYGTPKEHKQLNISQGYAKVQKRTPEKDITDNKSGLKIFMRDYFEAECQRKYLHFFVPATKELNLFAMEGKKKPTWELIEFNSAHQLPVHFKSIITPKGQIYLIGGNDATGKRDEVYRYDFANKSLELVGRMHRKRSSHTLCYLPNKIFIIGGLSNKDEPMTYCEVFDLESAQCIEIAPLVAATASCCAVPFNDSIYTIGVSEGYCLVQVYLNKKWSKVELSSAIEGNNFSAGVQINESYILVFGGYNAISEPTNTCFALKVAGPKAQVSYYNQVPLLYNEGFWDNNPIISQGKVYALQNIADEEEKNSTRAQHKRIIVFNGTKWI